MLRFDVEIPKNLEHLFSKGDNPQAIVLDALRFRAQYSDSLTDIKSMCLELLAREPQVVAPAPKVVAPTTPPPAPIPIRKTPVVKEDDDDDDDDFLSMILK